MKKTIIVLIVLMALVGLYTYIDNKIGTVSTVENNTARGTQSQK